MHWKTVVLAAALAVVPGFAQPALHLDVPFDFTANGSHWRAGAYEIAFPAQSAILIRNLDDKRVIFVPTVRAESLAHFDVAKVVFNRYGDSYFLSRIWTPISGRELIKSSAERELAARVPVVTVSSVARLPKHP